MVHYLIGRAGSGKTRAIYQQIKQTMRKHPQTKCILLVPEQITLQTERDLIQFLEEDGLLRAEVLSFDNLSRRILEDTGSDHFIELSRLGKTLLLKKILLEQNAQLNLYGDVGQGTGVLQQLMYTLEELNREEILPENLKELSEKQGEILFKKKLKDLSLLQEQLDQYLENHYLDEGARHQLVLTCISQCSFLKDSLIWADGFVHFTTPHLQLLEKLFSIAQDVTISLTLDTRADIRDKELFEPIRLIWGKIRNRAKNANVLEKEPVFFTTQNLSYKPEALHYFERYAFVYPAHPYKGVTNVLKIHKTESPYEEVVCAARQIISWVAQKQLRWKEIGIVVFQLETYAPLIERVFQSYGIPRFVAEQHSILHQPISQFLFATLETVRKNMRLEDVFAAFKTCLSLFTIEEYEELENYCLAWRIEGKRWQTPFTKGDPEQLVKLNQWREEFLNYSEDCFPALREAKTYGEITKALYHCIEVLHIREKLREQIIFFHQQQQIKYASQLEQAWKSVVEIMDQFVEILGDQPADLLQYIQILQAGLTSVEVSVIPDTQDQVIIEDMQHGIVPEVQALWVMGFHDGAFPYLDDQKGVLLPSEIEIFRENGLELNLGTNLQIMQEYYYVYRALTRAQQTIHFSYALSDGAGSGQKESIFLEQLIKIFPNMPCTSIMEEIDIPFGSQAVFPLLEEKLCFWRDGIEPGEEWKQIYGWYKEQPFWKQRIQNIEEALFYTNQPQNFKGEQIHQLYRVQQVIPISISRMERYAKCPFSQMIQYGMRPKERKILSLLTPSSDIGDYMHSLMECYGRTVDKQHLNWKTIQEQDCKRICKEVLEKISDSEMYKEVFETSFCSQYLRRCSEQMFYLSAWMMTSQIERGEYIPYKYELNFGRYGEVPPVEISLQNGEKVVLDGRIDRVDIYQEKDCVWLRIIDYKTGAKNFKLSDLYYGIGIQLVLYAVALLHVWGQTKSRIVRPAGMFFFHLDNPWLKEEEVSKRGFEAALLEEFCLNGLLLGDIEMIQKMDSMLKSKRTSEILPVGLNKEFGLRESNAVFSQDNLQILFNFVLLWIKSNTQRILEGKCRVYPTKDGVNTPCTYCQYHSICQFDELLPENKYHWLYKLENQTVIERMKQALESGKTEE